MENKDKGYVYILTNPSFREDWVKIGKSSRPVDIRSKELDNTAVPLPFEIFATMETVKYNEVEKLVHKTIDGLTNLRIRQSREFFNVAPQKALEIFKAIALTVDDAIVQEYRDNQPILTEPTTTTSSQNNQTITTPSTLPHIRSTKKTPFSFLKARIPIGSVLKCPNLPVTDTITVADERRITYKGETMYMTHFAHKILNKKYTGAGTEYFTYKDEWLNARRKRMEASGDYFD